MKRVRKVFFLIVCYVTLSFALKAEDRSFVEDICIQSARSQFLYGEPVVMYVVISNASSNAITAYTELQNGVLASYDQSCDNVAFRDISPGLYTDPVGERVVLNTHEAYRHDEIIFYDWDRKQPLFQVGTNYVRVRSGGKTSVSPCFVIVSPDNLADTTSSQIMTKREVMEAIALRNVSQVRNELKAIVELDSGLSPYAAFFLAAYYGGSETLEEKDRMLDIADVDGFPLRAQIVQQKGMLAQQQLEAQVTLKPEVLNVSPGVLTAFVRLPEGYPVKNIISATCDGAAYERMMLNDDGSEMIIKFRRQDIEKALAQVGGSLDTNFVVRGTWKMGAAGTKFYRGTDSITKIVGAKGANLSRSGRE